MINKKANINLDSVLITGSFLLTKIFLCDSIKTAQVSEIVALIRLD